jgi:hypothetical protein
MDEYSDIYVGILFVKNKDLVSISFIYKMWVNIPMYMWEYLFVLPCRDFISLENVGEYSDTFMGISFVKNKDLVSISFLYKKWVNIPIYMYMRILFVNNKDLANISFP